MSASAASGRLFDVAPALGDGEGFLAGCERRRRQLLDDVAQCDRELSRLHALAHALRELAGESAAAAAASRIAENGWSGSGEQLNPEQSDEALRIFAGLRAARRSRDGQSAQSGAPLRLCSVLLEDSTPCLLPLPHDQHRRPTPKDTNKASS